MKLRYLGFFWGWGTDKGFTVQNRPLSVWTRDFQPLPPSVSPLFFFIPFPGDLIGVFLGAKVQRRVEASCPTFFCAYCLDFLLYGIRGIASTVRPRVGKQYFLMGTSGFVLGL